MRTSFLCSLVALLAGLQAAGLGLGQRDLIGVLHVAATGLSVILGPGPRDPDHGPLGCGGATGARAATRGSGACSGRGRRLSRLGGLLRRLAGLLLFGKLGLDLLHRSRQGLNFVLGLLIFGLNVRVVGLEIVIFILESCILLLERGIVGLDLVVVLLGDAGGASCQNYAEQYSQE